MYQIEESLIDAIKQEPDGEVARVRYEEYLARTRHDEITLELLRREREIGDAWEDPEVFDQLVDEYIEFRASNPSYFRDERAGQLDCIFRRFHLWLVSYSSSRRFALEQAAKLVLNTTPDLDDPPVVLCTGGPRVRDKRDKFVEFVRRYRGASGQ